MTPQHAARAILRTLVSPLEIERGIELPAWLRPHQREPVLRAHAILERWNGALIADGVGLGKTYIGLALADIERRSGRVAVAITPAPLVEEWRKAAASVDVPIAVISHAALARRGPSLPSRCRLLLVDEAHAFRNPRTRRYDALARLAIGRRVALLTATAVNNTPADLVALVALFASRDSFTPFGVADIEEALYRGHERASLALAAISISRTRRLVENQHPELRGAFPRRRLLAPFRYDLDSTYGGRLRAMLAELSEIGRDDPAGALLRLSLLRRLESSRVALRRSLQRHRAFLLEWLRAWSEGIRLSRRNFARATPRGDSDDVQLVWWSILAPGSSGSQDAHDVRRSLDSVERALLTLDALADTPDAKLATLDSSLRTTLAGRKTIVFSEYRDTARHLFTALSGRHRCVLVTGQDAWMGRERIARSEALDAFAPRSRGSAPDPLRDADLLIATDVASEGLNLQDAAAVVSYDLPWNPVRIMQRAGRIDRLGSPHEEVAIGQLLPRSGLGDLTGVLARLKTKLEHAGPGAEPDPLAAVWWLGTSLDTETIEQESWRRVAPFESRERWRAALDASREGWPPSKALQRVPLVAAGLVSDGGPPAAGLLFTVSWPGGEAIPLAWVARPGCAPRSDPHALGELALRALEARPLPADAQAFADLVSQVLPDARATLAELSAQRHGAGCRSPGRQAALAALQRGTSAAVTARMDTSALSVALAALRRDLPAGLDRYILRMTKEMPDVEQLARRIAEIVAAAPRTQGVERSLETPRLDLMVAIVLAADGPC